MTVWLVSFSPEAGDRLARAFRPPADFTGGRLEIVRTALGVTDLSRDPAGALLLDPSLAAVVFALEAAGLDHPRYVELLHWCAARTARRADFRLFA